MIINHYERILKLPHPMVCATLAKTWLFYLPIRKVKE